MRAGIYSRVSSDPRDRGRSVKEQEDDGRGWVQAEGWTLAEVYVDNDVSASRYSKKERPDWLRLTEDIAAGKLDVLVAWEVSRATRDRVVWAALVEACLDKGVKLCVGGRLHDLEDPDDAFVLDLAALLAVRESSVTRKRVLRAVIANAEKGTPHGKRLFGYRRVYDETSGDLKDQIPDEVTAPIVQEAAKRVLSGETPYAVAQDFNERGIPTPRGGKSWDLTQVKRLCVNPGYAGLRVHRGKVVGEASWPAIIEPDAHHALVAKLSDPARRTQRSSAVKHLLSGLAVCGVCSGRIRVQKNRGFLAYLCVDGFHVSRREDYADAVVTSIVVGRLAQADALDLLRKEDAASEDVASALTEAREKRARLEGFYDAAASGELTPAALARIEGRLLPEIEQAEERSRRAGIAPVVGEIAGPDAAEKWDRLSIAQRRELIDATVTVRILPTVRGSRTFRAERVEVTWRGESGVTDNEADAVSLGLREGRGGGETLSGVLLDRGTDSVGE